MINASLSRKLMFASTDVTLYLPSLTVVGEEDAIVQVCVTLVSVENIQRRVMFMLETNDSTGTR